MNEDKPFQPLRIPAAVIISAFTVIALTEIYGLDTESTSFDLPTTIVILIFWMISTGVAAWNSPPSARGRKRGIHYHRPHWREDTNKQ